MTKKFLTAFFILIGTVSLSTAQTVLKGTITDEETGAPIPGATVRVINTSNGAYTSSTGRFVLKLKSGDVTLKVSSIGYLAKTVKLAGKDLSKDIDFKLKADAVYAKTVVVYGMSAEKIAARAIEKRKENKSLKKTLRAVVYSKAGLIFDDITARMMAKAGDKSFSVSVTSDKIDSSVIAESKYIIAESFSNYYCDFDKNIRLTEVIQKRQTKNVPTGNGVMALTDFIDLTADEINLFGTRMVPPIGESALSHYDYSLEETLFDDGRKVFSINFKPKSDLFPGFVGNMLIIDSAFELISIKMKPSESTAINFVEGLMFEQKLKEVERDIWVPDYLVTEAKADVEFLKGIAEFKLNFKITTILNEIIINKPLPDSIYTLAKRGVDKIVAPSVDTAKSAFWENNAMSELSKEEKAIYAKVDTAVRIADSVRQVDSVHSVSFLNRITDVDPIVDFNRVGSVTLGLSKSFSYRNYDTTYHGFSVDLTPSYMYSFGQRRNFGSGELKIKYGSFKNYLLLKAGAYSEIRNTVFNPPYSSIVNTVASALFHSDYYDYMRRDGWFAELNYEFNRLDMSVSYDESRQFSVKKTTDRSSYSKSDWRPNPTIDDGAFREFAVKISYGNSLIYTVTDDFDYYFSVSGTYTDPVRYTNKAGSERFRSAEALGVFNLPLIATGYKPISLRTAFFGGIADESVDVQSMFKMKTNLVFYAASPAMCSAPYSAYAGTKYYGVQGDLNLSDLAWRALGLPLFYGRGPELFVCGSAAKYERNMSPFYSDTKGMYYTEVGFGFSRIPVFISNVAYWSISFNWGVGPLGSGKFGVAVNISLPF